MMKSKKRLLLLVSLLLLSLILITGCTKKNTEETEKAVPENQQKTEETKNVADEIETIDSLIDNADLSGAVMEIKSKGIVISQSREEGTTNSGETVVRTIKDEDTIAVEFTEKTTFQRLIIKDKKDGRLETGSQSDLSIDGSVDLYGSNAGNKFVATKVIVTITE